MIAADTNTWIAFFDGATGPDTEALAKALKERQVWMVPVVLTELLSAPELSSAIREILADLPLLEITADYWEKAGSLRAKALRLRRKARLGDALIAQCCLDHGILFLTRDHDFRVFAETAGLALG
jgi:predicted nucleic acid-binding protein